jgi:4-hydroxy-3-polyprenylbenzoate decarboxylase
MPHPQSARAFLAELESRRLLKLIGEPVEPRFEISAWLCQVGDSHALRFDRVAGSSMRVFANLLCSRDRIALGLGTSAHALQRKLVDAIGAARDPVVVGDAPCQEVVVDDPGWDELPVPTFFEHETGPYLTAGVIAARDPASGRCNLSYARIKPLSEDRAFIGIAPEHHLAVFARRAHGPLPVAVTLGNHPAVLLAGALYLDEGEDELRVASALLEKPLEAARTRDGILVPAHCELVLEGEIDASRKIEEGPVSEYHGLYEDYGSGYELRLKRITRRRDAMLQVIQPGLYPEHVWIGGEAIAASLRRRLAARFAGLREVAVTPGGVGRLHAVVAVAGAPARQVIEAVWESVRLIKLVTVVDEDVDPWDPVRVERALATRMKADRDLMVVPGARTSRSDPLEENGRIAKLGIDATRKDGDRDDWRAAQPPAAVMARVRGKLESQ